MAVTGEPGLVVCMHVFFFKTVEAFFFSSCFFFLDKAVSCLWPWREVITGPTSLLELTGGPRGNLEVSGARVSVDPRGGAP